MLSIHINSEAADDILEIVAWSVDHFGWDAAERYNDLIETALWDLRLDPDRPGVNRGALRLRPIACIISGIAVTGAIHRLAS